MNKLNVSVVHADLKMSSYPLLLGHFKEDGIINAEKTLNDRFQNELEEYFQIQDYPTEIGMKKVLLNIKLNPIGAIIVGLGESRFLSEHTLSKAVTAGVKSYVIKAQKSLTGEYSKLANGISSLCIASGYGNLSMTESLSAILSGITIANEELVKINPLLHKIKNVEFIENVNYIASKAYATLHKLEKTIPNIVLQKDIIENYGRIKSISHEERKKRWHIFTTEYVSDNEDTFKLRMRLNSGSAKIEEEHVYFEGVKDNQIINGIKLRNYWEESESKGLFQRLIPQSFKHVLDSQLNIIWQLDKYTAAIPWELIHADAEEKTPTFVNTGLIRQLISKDNKKKTKILRSNTALIVGQPKYDDREGLPNLKRSKEEVESIIKMLELENFKIVPKIDKKGENNYMAMLNQDYKILHVAAHGKYYIEGGQVGIALGSDRYFGPQDFNNKSSIPEFAFINCCYSGAIDSEEEEYSQKQYKIAANIGTQLIDMGSEAVIVAGWTINDMSAKEFALVIYAELLAGNTFGEAVKKARQQCYTKNKTSTTWAAFQCYGNPNYRLIKKTPEAKIQDEYILKEDVLIDLQNLLSSTEDKNKLKIKECIDTLKEYMEKAQKGNFQSSDIIEMQAKIYQECGMVEEAFSIYSELLEKEDSDFSVKSLEQYCNVFAKVLLKRFNENPTRVTEEDKRVLYSKLKNLSIIGITSERLSLQGSGFKRLALMTEDQKSAIIYLEQMRDKYKEAYDLIMSTSENPRKTQKSIYSLCNWLTGIALTKHNDPERQKYYKILAEIKAKLDSKMMAGKVFWDDISVINVEMCQMLFIDRTGPNFSHKLENIKVNIISNYEKHWNLVGTKKNLHSEMEHLELLIRFVNSERLKVTFKQILNKFETRNASETDEHSASKTHE